MAIREGGAPSHTQVKGCGTRRQISNPAKESTCVNIMELRCNGYGRGSWLTGI